MDANIQIFRNNVTATRTHPCRAVWVNPWRQPTSPFCLVSCEVHELTPGSVTNTLVHAAPVPILHILNVQVLKSDDLVLVDQSPTQFVSEVFTAIADTGINVLDDALLLMILQRAFHALAQSVLRLGKRFLILAEEAWIGNVLASREGSKVNQAYVNADNLRRRWQRLWLDDAREAGIPVAQSISPDGQRLDLALNRPVQLDLDGADLRDIELIIKSKSRLWIGERIVTIMTTEPRIARSLSCLHAAKKGIECKIDASLGILKTLRVDIGKLRSFLLPLSQQFIGIVQRQGFLAFLPGLAAYLKGLIIYRSASIQRFIHRCTLSLSRIESELERLHGIIIAELTRLVKYVEKAFIPWINRGAFCPEVL